MFDIASDPSVDLAKTDDVTLSLHDIFPEQKKTKRRPPDSIRRPPPPPSLTINDEMTRLNIPDFLQHSYLTGLPPPVIAHLRQWQIDLITRPEFQDRRSAIVLVPTSGGKTVAADIAIAHLLRDDPGAKAIYALPFVALANEKFLEFTKRFFKFSVRAFYQNVGGPDFRRGQIAVCTYEKAHSLINAAILGKYSERLKLLVVDEIHMIGEEHRGPVVEALVVKALLLRPRMRIIGLTATVNVNDGQRLADWIDGFNFVSDVRPSQVRQLLKTIEGDLKILENGRLGSKIASLKAPIGDPCHVMDPIRRLLQRSLEPSVLIFVNTRADTHRFAELISARLYDKTVELPCVPQASTAIMDARKKLIQDIVKAAGGIDEPIRRCLLNGVSVHHAGLLLEERKLIEEAARNKVISILVATTTLSAGVNIHSVSRVFIMGIYRKTIDGNVRIPSSQFTQMVGRAGRTEGQSGDAVIFAQTSHPSEITDIIKLSTHEIPDITPHLRDAGELERFYLQSLAIGLVLPEGGITDFLSSTFRFQNEEADESATERLVKLGLIHNGNHAATALGRSIAGSSISIEEGLQMAEVVKQMQMDLCLTDEVHLLYLCVSTQIAATLKPEPYNSPIWLEIFDRHRHVLRLITKMDDRAIDHMQDLPAIFGGAGRNNKEQDSHFDRVYVAAIMRELINEVAITEITRKFKIDRGTIQSLQMQCASFAGQMSKFCELFGAGLLAATLTRFRQRLNFGARTELLGLIVLPSCSRNVARRLVNCGITSPIELADLKVEAIAPLIAAKGQAGEGRAASDDDFEAAERILRDAIEYTESLTRLEVLEETALQNIS
jgi:replicative superfamily II helicase